MLATTSGQVGFFDAAELVGPLPEGSFFALLAEHGDRIVRDEDFAACYSPGMGRPSIPPSQLARVLLLQYRTGASDEAAMEAIAWDLRWKVALGLAVDHRGWHPTSLTKFRARLLLHRLERVALENTLVLAEELGMLEGQHQRFDGFKLSAAVTNTTEPLITAVDVAPASEQDGPQAKHLIDAQPPERRPDRVLGDTAYGIGPVRAELAERGVDVLAPLAPGMTKPDRFGKRDFHVDLDAGTVTCPAGEIASIRTEPSGKRRARFAKAGCDHCHLRDACVSPARGDRHILLAPDEALLIAARQALEDPATAEHLRRTRPRIERLLGLLAHRYKARKSRYIGTRKAASKPPGPPP
jgi:transposase